VDENNKVDEVSYYFLDESVFSTLSRDEMIKERIRQGFCRNTLVIQKEKNSLLFPFLKDSDLRSLREEICRSKTQEIQAISTGNKLVVLTLNEEKTQINFEFFSLK
jgi:hypothetical protein